MVILYLPAEEMKKVLLLVYYWPPSGGSSVQRWLKMLKYFPELGFEPIVITVDPKLASYPVIDPSLGEDIRSNLIVYKTPTFEFYNLYKKITFRKEIPYAGFVNEKKVDFFQWLSRSIRSNFFITDPRRGWNRYAYKKAIEIISANKIETVITSSPPHSTQLIGLRLKKKLNIRWIADLQDPWTDIYYYKELYHSFVSGRIDACYERKVLIEADKVVTVSDPIKRMFTSKSSRIDPSKIMVIPNGFDEEDFGEKGQSDPGKLVITYTGTIKEDYKIDALLSAIGKVAARGETILLRFAGRISAGIKEKIISTPHIETEFYDYVPHLESVKFILRSDALLLIIPKIENNKGILTGKLFEYLGSGLKIIGIGPADSDAGKIIRECSSGEMFEYDDEKAIEANVIKLTEMKKSGMAPVNRKMINLYSRRNQALEITKIL